MLSGTSDGMHPLAATSAPQGYGLLYILVLMQRPALCPSRSWQ